MKKSTLNSLLKNNVKFKLLFCLQLSFLIISFSSQAVAQWQKLSSFPAMNVNNIEIDPVNPQQMWAGTSTISNNTSTSGLYRSQNNGLTWTPVNVQRNTGIPVSGTAVRSISIAPDNNFSSQFMLVAFSNGGIFRSIDGGNSFAEAQIPNPQFQGSFLTQNVSQVVVTRQQGNTRKLYAVVESGSAINTSGLYSASITSTSQQIFWQKVGYQQNNIQKLIVDPLNSNILYILTSNSVLMKSNDGGLNFFISNSGLFSGVGAIVTDLIIDPIVSSTLYASGFQSGIKGFYTSTNSGLSWTVVNQLEVFKKIAINSSIGLKTLYGIKNEVSFTGVPNKDVVYQSQNNGISWTPLENAFQSQITSSTLNTIQVNNGSIFVGGNDGLFSYNNSFGGLPNGLSVTASTNAMNVQPGGLVTVNLTVTNTSVSALNNVNVTGNTLPFGTTLSNIGAPECSLISTQVNCMLNNLMPNVPVTKTLTFTMPFTINTSSVLTFNASTISPTTGQQLSGSSAAINLSGSSQGVGNGLSLSVTSTPATITQGGQVTFSLNINNLTTLAMPTVSLTGGVFPVGTTMFDSTNECSIVSTQIQCNLYNLIPSVSKIKTIVVNMPATQAVSTAPITFSARTPDGLYTASSTPLSLSNKSTNPNLSFVVTPTNFSVTPGQIATFNLTVTNRSQTLLTNATISSTSFPVGTVQGTLSPGCTFISNTVSCQIASLQQNLPTNLSISVIMPATIQTSMIPPITFTLNAPPNAAMTTAVSLFSSNGTGNLLAKPGVGTIATGNTYSGIFLSSSVNTNTVYQLSNQPQKGTFSWSLASCINQLSCSSGGFTYKPFNSSGGQMEILQFQVRDNSTATASAMSTYSINITGSNANGGAVSLFMLFLFMLMTLRLNKVKQFSRLSQ